MEKGEVGITPAHVSTSNSNAPNKAKYFPSTQVVIAALNEQEGIGLTIAELKLHLDKPKIIVVDGKSIDQTTQVAKNLDAQVVYQDGKGKGDAFAKGVKCITSDTDYIVVTDADYTYPAQHIPAMIQILEKNPKVGMVCGNRFSGDTNSAAFNSLLTLGNKLIALTHNVLNGTRLQDPLTGLRVIRANILRNWHIKSEGFDIEVELNHYVQQKGYQIKEIPIHYRPRIGEKKLKVRHAISILKRIILETIR